MSKREKTSSSSKFWQRLFWWSGIACLIGAIAALYLDVPATALVSLGGVGLLLCLISLALEIRRKGFTADNVFALCSVLALSCGLPGYFFSDITWVLVSAYAGFFFFFFAGFGARIWSQWGDTKDLWHRWKRHRSEKKTAAEFQKSNPLAQEIYHPTPSADAKPAKKNCPPLC